MNHTLIYNLPNWYTFLVGDKSEDGEYNKTGIQTGPAVN